jgi:5-methylcytosine-specific restriction endonuclease McrA
METVDSKRSLTKKELAPILRAQDDKCECCGKEITLKEAVAGHIIAHSKGGLSTRENTVALCQPCNSKQGDMNYYEFKELVSTGTLLI